MKNFKEIMEEIQFQLIELNNGNIDRPDFCNAIAEIYEHFNNKL